MDKKIFLVLILIGIILIAGCIGEYIQIESPGEALKAMTVGASDQVDRMASFSSSGPTMEGNIKPEVVAPGVNIIAARASGTSMGTVIDSYYTMASGTSMATPQVAGAAALLIQAYKSTHGGQRPRPELIKAALMLGADKLKDSYGIEYDAFHQGTGRIDINNSYWLLMNNNVTIAVIPNLWNISTYTESPERETSLSEPMLLYGLIPGSSTSGRFTIIIGKQLQNLTVRTGGEIAGWITFRPQNISYIELGNRSESHQVIDVNVDVPTNIPGGIYTGFINFSWNNGSMLVPCDVKIAQKISLTNGTASLNGTINVTNTTYYFIEVPPATQTKLYFTSNLSTNDRFYVVSPSKEIVDLSSSTSLGNPTTGNYTIVLRTYRMDPTIQTLLNYTNLSYDVINSTNKTYLFYFSPTRPFKLNKVIVNLTLHINDSESDISVLLNGNELINITANTTDQNYSIDITSNIIFGYNNLSLSTDFTNKVIYLSKILIIANTSPTYELNSTLYAIKSEPTDVYVLFDINETNKTLNLTYYNFGVPLTNVSWFIYCGERVKSTGSGTIQLTSRSYSDWPYNTYTYNLNVPSGIVKMSINIVPDDFSEGVVITIYNPNNVTYLGGWYYSSTTFQTYDIVPGNWRIVFSKYGYNHTVNILYTFYEASNCSGININNSFNSLESNANKNLSIYIDVTNNTGKVIKGYIKGYDPNLTIITPITIASYLNFTQQLNLTIKDDELWGMISSPENGTYRILFNISSNRTVIPMMAVKVDVDSFFVKQNEISGNLSKSSCYQTFVTIDYDLKNSTGANMSDGFLDATGYYVGNIPTTNHKFYLGSFMLQHTPPNYSTVYAPQNCGNSCSNACSISLNEYVIDSTQTYKYYKFTINESKLITVTLSMDSGVDYDLYTEWYGNCPDSSHWSCRPYTGGSATESCSSILTAGTYYIMVDLWSGVGNYTLSVSTTTYTPNMLVSDKGYLYFDSDSDDDFSDETQISQNSNITIHGLNFTAYQISVYSTHAYVSLSSPLCGYSSYLYYGKIDGKEAVYGSNDKLVFDANNDTLLDYQTESSSLNGVIQNYLFNSVVDMGNLKKIILRDLNSPLYIDLIPNKTYDVVLKLKTTSENETNVSITPSLQYVGLHILNIINKSELIYGDVVNLTGIVNNTGGLNVSGNYTLNLCFENGTVIQNLFNESIELEDNQAISNSTLLSLFYNPGKYKLIYKFDFASPDSNSIIGEDKIEINPPLSISVSASNIFVTNSTYLVNFTLTNLINESIEGTFLFFYIKNNSYYLINSTPLNISTSETKNLGYTHTFSEVGNYFLLGSFDYTNLAIERTNISKRISVAMRYGGYCGDGVCRGDLGESCSNCPQDCGKCDGVSCSSASECQGKYCCNGICSSTPCNPCAGVNCGSNAYCSGGVCYCNSGYYNCDGSWSNGCESSTQCVWTPPSSIVGLNVSSGTIQVTVNNSGQFNFIVNIKNIYTRKVENISFVCVSFTNCSWISSSPSAMSLDPGAQSAFTVTVNVPPGHENKNLTLLYGAAGKSNVTTVESNIASLLVIVKLITTPETDTISIVNFDVPASANVSEEIRASVVIRNNGTTDKTVTVDILAPFPLQTDPARSITISRNSSSTTDFIIRNLNTSGIYTITARVRYLVNNVSTEKTMSKSLTVIKVSEAGPQQNQTQRVYAPGNTTITIEIAGEIKNVSVEYKPISDIAASKMNVDLRGAISSISGEMSEINEVKVSEENMNPYYEISGVSKKKVLLLFEARINTKAIIDASNGTIISLTKEDKNLRTIEMFSLLALGLPGFILTLIIKMLGWIG
ncbi:MAG: S8 family serine peptidase [Candidatus Parvarchaeota archaeon]|nr:S8 family serine peptidase [Candidatus Jingweiarchaeum tengchongense]MCW1298032.1 S8 family serine peptidase [Candidatus Jingweiarchaeum tengchongense]MCW1300168.1 S8 family serine peptidase [Candidatus Jingweiarchaeum tengchongense]MCW1304378.1 S8 family serine peptidase [Candidatus Jingweiarchaeum tengchongense]MCW1305902.1 S8 family serine peptidase [Candidatus Jingweiarchaeum tengchongense]